MYDEMKENVLKANKSLPALQLVILTWGNVSCIDREKNIVAIKPSGIPYERLTINDIVITDLEGNVIEGTCRPSSDLMTHLCLYKAFTDISAIVHTHSKWATVWAQAHREIPIYGTTHADYFYGDIPCTKAMCKSRIQEEYEWNTGVQIIETFQKHNLSSKEMQAVLVDSHGPFVWGDSCDKAVENAYVLETIAEMAYYRENLSHEQNNSLNNELLNRHYFRKHGKDAYYGQ